MWHCTHCPMVLRTFPLYEHLRRTKLCPKMLGALGQQHRLDRPLPLFVQGPLRQAYPQPPVTTTINGVTTQPTHKLAFYRGLYICLRCGHMAHTEVHKLKDACHAPRPAGATNLKRMRQDKPPYHIKRRYKGWPLVEKQAIPQNVLIPILSKAHLKRQIPLPSPIQISDLPEEGIWDESLGLDDAEGPEALGS